MPALTAVIRSLLSHRNGHAVRLSHGLALRYTPATKEYGSKASTLSLSRPSVPPSPTEVQVVVNTLATVLGEPGKEYLVTGAGNVRRIHFLNTLTKDLSDERETNSIQRGDGQGHLGEPQNADAADTEAATARPLATDGHGNNDPQGLAA